ncbi:MAG TPA: DUF4062 domain-containing protein [Terriglobia bacterium]|nr:DUF4062 domain-containing protein [Terriglobia bacterium]
MSAAKPNPNVPVVFISSTVEDLKAYRDAARFEAERAGFRVLWQEYFVAGGDKPPLEKCLDEVAKADVLVVIVAHRYGWVPPDQPSGGTKSITRLECEEALREGNGKKKVEVIAFLVDADSQDFKWPLERREEYRVTAAILSGKATPQLLAEVQRNVTNLQEFKQWLSGRGIRRTFTDVGTLRAEVVAALVEWRKRHPEFEEPAPPPGRSDPTKYLESLREQTGWINIRGLQVGTGKAQRFPIDELYIPLTTAETSAEHRVDVAARPATESGAEKDLSPTGRERVELEDMLRYRRLVIVGDPGAGKTTFLSRIAFALSDALLKREAAAAESLPVAPAGAVGGESARGPSFLTRLTGALRRTFAPVATETGAIKGESQTGRTEGTTDAEPSFPILIRIAELSEHIRKCAEREERERPTTEANPAWLVDFLGDQSAGQKWGLDKAFFERKLDDGSAVLLLDGLDEPPGRIEREGMARLFEKATRAYRRCRFVVTTRPLAYVGETVLDGFETVQIEPLEPEAIEKFLEHWCHALFPDTPKQAERHLAELAEALRSTPEIRRMARNPVMLTALAASTGTSVGCPSNERNSTSPS